MTEKKIEDYLHLYLGCECEVDRTSANMSKKKGVFMGVLITETVTFYEVLHDGNNRQAYHNFAVKPILRPLSDMTEEELKEVATICYKKIYDSLPEFYKVEHVPDNEGGGLRWEEDGVPHDWHYGLTVTEEGILFSADGSYLNVPVYEVTRYLLSKHFDLFSLIESGVAIDKTKHKG